MDWLYSQIQRLARASLSVLGAPPTLANRFYAELLVTIGLLVALDLGIWLAVAILAANGHPPLVGA